MLLTEQILIKQRKFSKKPGKKKNKTKCLYTQIYCVKVAADFTVRKNMIGSLFLATKWIKIKSSRYLQILLFFLSTKYPHENCIKYFLPLMIKMWIRFCNLAKVKLLRNLISLNKDYRENAESVEKSTFYGWIRQ